MQVTSSVRQPLVTGGKTYHDVTHDVCRQVEGKPSKLWFLAFLTAVSVLGLGSIATLSSGIFAKLEGGNNFEGIQSFGDGQINRFSATVNEQTNATYEILQSDNGKVITFDNDSSAISVTIDSSLDPGFNCLLVQLGDGQVRLSSSVLNRYNHTKLVGQYSIATLVKISNDIIILSGDTTSDNSGP